ncbi:MAG: TetR/AcrR family transcriptional regulator [Ilumatobacter sp.]|uniref:TetR/AcrR family transcriptional regulator n=1 Tax=Ilumatobacter sp. TaxID=1967498 RepID=UPI002601A972|nr:TetR/AcrR family transcriptional regulator [Ilumatobacter sp.]MDJ0768026.1 TetR/AcrR family transcriptional regulator [Ilumatobacter sp.]
MKTAPQQDRSRATVERLLAAANDEFALHGVAGATTTAIAERAGVSVGSLYRFFGDKEAVAAALADRYLEDAAAAFGPIISAIRRQADIVGAARELVRAAAELQTVHAGYYRITEDVRPDAAGSPASGVRTAVVGAFAEVFDHLGLGPSPAVRRRIVTLLTETVRHELALSAGAEDRAERLTELEELAVGYLVQRLDLGGEPRISDGVDLGDEPAQG